VTIVGVLGRLIAVERKVYKVFVIYKGLEVVKRSKVVVGQKDTLER